MQSYAMVSSRPSIWLLVAEWLITDCVIGLGGTSLINANVFLEADKETLAMGQWPEEIRKNPSCLDECKPGNP
jgi:hypothetical protein